MEAWRWLAKKWSTPEWIVSSKSHRENRGKAGPEHRFGADGHYSLARRMMAYGEEMTQRDGPDFDWRQAEVDAEALHARHCTQVAGEEGMAEYISSKEIGFVVWEFSLLKDSSRYPGREGGSCSMRGGSSGNTNGRAADKHDSQHGFLPSARLGPNVNLPPFCPPQMSPQQGRQGGCHHLRARNHLWGGRWYPRPPSHLRSGRWYPSAPRHLRGGWNRRALSQLRGRWHHRALSHLLVGWHPQAPSHLRGGCHPRAQCHLQGGCQLLHHTSTRGCNHLFSTMDHRVRPHVLVAQLQMRK
ncbi:hypothetical protein U9M48_039323 [Paspalum notatum var. saurae]|uniref:Uncharacterized protein n=1 Tax=Paspalum notatum var. saurae TaxID=547442 RepID=A0AAQ3XBB0_PASNO